MSDVKHPDVTVKLVGEDGNAFAIIGRVRKALWKAKGQEEANVFLKEATTSGSYDGVLQTCMRWVTVE